jgi:hypothetical protein
MEGLASLWSMIRGRRYSRPVGARAWRRHGRCRSRARGQRPNLEYLEARLNLTTRFIVPLEVAVDNHSTFHSVHDALIAPGIVSGDSIEIMQGSSPGDALNSLLPDVTNFSIRGEPGVGPADLSPLIFTDAVTITHAQQGFTLQNINLNIAGGTLTFQANGTLQGDQIAVNAANSNGIVVDDSVSEILIQNNEFSATTNQVVIEMTSSAGSHNLISNNFFTSSTAQHEILYVGSGLTSDIIRDNDFVGNEATSFDFNYMVFVSTGVDGLSIEGNSFRDPDALQGAITAELGDQYLSITDNTIDFSGAGGDGIDVFAGPDGATTSVSIIGNTISAGTGNGMILGTSSTGSFHALVQANDFLTGKAGILLFSDGASMADIDLGGGAQGSLGANNLRFDRTAASNQLTGAIVVEQGTGVVSAQNNLFSSIGPAASDFDSADNPALATVVTTGNLTGNAAFVQALYGRFLHRAANLASAGDGGAFVTELNDGVAAASVVNTISRSSEAFGFVVDDLYHAILNRDADAAGKASFVNQLVAGATLESVEAFFYGSPEYLDRYSGGRAFVVSLYSQVLGRVAADSEYQPWVAQIPTLGRTGVAAAILNSAEARGQAAASFYPELLKRTVSTAEIASWANSGLDELSIQTDIAASSEGQANM